MFYFSHCVLLYLYFNSKTFRICQIRNIFSCESKLRVSFYLNRECVWESDWQRGERNSLERIYHHQHHLYDHDTKFIPLFIPLSWKRVCCFSFVSFFFCFKEKHRMFVFSILKNVLSFSSSLMFFSVQDLKFVRISWLHFLSLSLEILGMATTL